jgi:hypothetical protein
LHIYKLMWDVLVHMPNLTEWKYKF